jgi:hypothetical protein
VRDTEGFHRERSLRRAAQCAEEAAHAASEEDRVLLAAEERSWRLLAADSMIWSVFERALEDLEDGPPREG